ncbi:MAG TPA: sulfite oxidase-like oxidoreductase [Acidimicrobiia bacterium]|nr:sulfite oxidase-like oxidoreductase [Acidimicrobiia bacterium]
MTFVSRGFKGRRQVEAVPDRVPPGQYVTDDFPVLSAGPTPLILSENWRFTITTENGEESTWTWDQFLQLPQEQITVDIHCVTKWSKLDTRWEGVSIDTLLDGVKTSALFALAHSVGGYTTNIPLTDLTGGKAWVAHTYAGAPLRAEHGGPARLLVPHLYLWKSAKWVQGLALTTKESPGFWESYGYHIYGDPWKEQRYVGD